jgi:hypothetical protein
MSPDTAGQFGRLVAERLGADLAAVPPEPGQARLGGLRVTVPASQEAGVGSLAATTAAAIARALRAGVAR